MNKILFLLLITLIIFASCGVILDPLRVEGSWDLESVEFYSYNPTLLTLQKYTSIDDNNPSSNRPVLREFFSDRDNTEDATYTITFDNNNDLKVERGSTTLVDIDKGDWSINSFENSLSVKIKKNNDVTTDVSGFWRDGFTFSNYWPMINYSTLELTIKASDAGKSSFTVYLKNKSIKVDTMKATFLKQ